MPFFAGLSPSTLALVLPLIAAASAKTDLAGCTSTQINNQITWYVPETNEICSIISGCGGDRAGPPRQDIPGCAAYTGTATVTPSYLNVPTPAAGDDTLPSDVLIYAVQNTRPTDGTTIAALASPSVPTDYDASPSSSSLVETSAPTLPAGYVSTPASDNTPIASPSSTTITPSTLPVTTPALFPAGGNGTLSLTVVGTSTAIVPADTPSEPATSSPIEQVGSTASTMFVSGIAVLVGLSAVMAML